MTQSSATSCSALSNHLVFALPNVWKFQQSVNFRSKMLEAVNRGLINAVLWQSVEFSG